MFQHLLYQNNIYSNQGSLYTQGGVYANSRSGTPETSPQVELLDNDGALLMDNDGAQLIDNG